MIDVRMILQELVQLFLIKKLTKLIMVNMNDNSSTTTFPCDCVRLSFTSNFSLLVKSFVFKTCLQICNHYSLSTALRMQRGPGPQPVIGQPSRGRGVVGRSYHSH